MSMLNKEWKTLYNLPVLNVVQEILKALKDENIVHIGCDSQRFDKEQHFVISVCLIYPGHGGRAWYTKIKEPQTNSIREKLFKEALNSIQVGLELSPHLPKKCEIIIHLDATPNTKFKSSGSVKELVGMVVGQGFRYFLKPDAFAANSIGDYIVKGKNV